MTRVQVPSKTGPQVYKVWPRHSCTCQGFQHRETCSHLRAASAHPERFVPVGEELGGLWRMPCELPQPIAPLMRFLDLHRIAIVSLGLPSTEAWGAWEPGLREALAGAGVMVHEFNDMAAVRRMAARHRAAVVIEGPEPWEQA